MTRIKQTGYCIKCLRRFSKKQTPPDRQCPTCLEPLRYNNKRTVSQIVTRCARKRGIKPPTTKTIYQIYLASTTWKQIRRRVLNRDGSVCAICHSDANLVHHRSYDKDVLDGNRDEDLVSLCHHCHETIEFTITRGGRRVKNSLQDANRKLDEAIARRSARLQPADQSLPYLGIELQESKDTKPVCKNPQVDLATEPLDRLGCNATSFELAANPST